MDNGFQDVLQNSKLHRMIVQRNDQGEVIYIDETTGNAILFKGDCIKKAYRYGKNFLSMLSYHASLGQALFEFEFFPNETYNKFNELYAELKERDANA